MKYIYAFIMFLLFIVLIVFTISIGRSFTSSTKNTTATKAVFKLSDEATSNTTIIIYAYGPVTANENFKTIKLSISNTARVGEVYKGYENALIAQKSYGNNSVAMSTLLGALDTIGTGKERTPEKNTDEQSCPNGIRYVIEMRNGSDVKLRRWATSCEGVKGNFGANYPAVYNLLQKQFPEYSALSEASGLGVGY
jgi:hypothetical protein